MSDEQAICPHCGKGVSQQVLGMCPQCMLKAGLSGFTDDGSIPEPASRFVPPTVEELGRYFPQLEILELIGRGGMGAVYKARQKQLDRIVALKILPPGIGDGPAFANRFTREAKALAALAHPNIVTLYEFGQTDGLFFFLMEYVDGMNLRQLLAGGKLAPKEALAIVPHICDALQYAHDRGIVHRDIKPENILLGRDGVVKIADFGVAKIIGKAETRTAETAAARETAATMAGVAGTPAYMAPEQLHRPAEVDHRADIYSLGVVLYQMLTGELPGKHIEPPSRKVQIDVRIDEIVMRALERNPEMRYSQASVFKTEVETVAGETQNGQCKMQNGEELAPDGRHVAPAASNDSPPARFSRTAIVGVCWSYFAVLAALFWWVATDGGPGQNPTAFSYLLTLTLVPLGIAAPFGTTILGWVAVAQIRRSSGRIYGLPLALFDAMLFPLLALDFITNLVLARGWWAFASLAKDTSIAPYSKATIVIVDILILLAWVVLDYLIVRRVWRAVSKPLNGQQQSPPPATAKEQTNQVRPTQRESEQPSNRHPAWVLAVVTLAVHTAAFLALGLFAFFIIPKFGMIFNDMKTELPLLTRMTMTLSDGMTVTMPLFLAVNAGICLLLGYLNARRSLIGWLICGTALLLAVGGAMLLSLFLPILSLMQSVK